MEALGMPLREIEEKYTKSEVILMAWSSQEQGFQMRQKTQQHAAKPKPDGHTPPQRIAEINKQAENVMQIVEHLDKAPVDKDGYFSLKNLKGDDALRVLAAKGFSFAPSLR